jgi:ATP-dependent Clp protease ATP-binding subunit ClpC
MFDRYTENARRAIFFGRYEASQFGSPYIETEHLLLGVLREDYGLVKQLFSQPGAVEDIRKEIEQATSVKEKVSTAVDLPLTNESKRTLAYAAEEAERLSHKHIGTEHLLLGLLREEKCFAAKLLNDRKVYVSQVRELIRNPKATSQAGSAKASQSLGSSEASQGSVSLSSFGVDLTAQAARDLLPPLIGREGELQRVIQILCRFARNNVVLVGEPGVGKRAIVFGLAQRISKGIAPGLHGRGILQLDLAVIASGIKSQTRFEENMERILTQLAGYGSPILFIEGLRVLAETQRFLNVFNVIKPALLQGKVQCISTAAPTEYRKAVEAAPWMEQCFSVIEVKPATEAESVQVLAGIKERFEKFHGVTYTEEALEYAVFHANSHFANRYLPEKAVDLMDEAGALVKLQHARLPDEVRECWKKMRLIQRHQDAAIANHEFQKANSYAEEMKKETTNLEALRKKYNLQEPATPTVTRHDVEQIVAERTGLSFEQLHQPKAARREDKP